MSSRHDENMNKGLNQSSLLRYTKPKPRKSASAARSTGDVSTSQTDGAPFTVEGAPSLKSSEYRLRTTSNVEPTLATHATTSESSSSGTPREVKEDRAPYTSSSRYNIYSSPIPGLSMGDAGVDWSESERPISTILEPKVHALKRKASEWAEPPELGDRLFKKRRWRADSSSSSASTSETSGKSKSGGQHTVTPSKLGGSTLTKKVLERLPFKRLFDDPEFDLDAGSGFIIQSSQSQPLLSPVSPHSIQASSSPVGDAILVGSSQTPSPLKMLSQPMRDFSSSPLKGPASRSPFKEPHPPAEVTVRRRRRVPDGSTSLFGVMHNFNFDFESLSNLIPKSNAKRIRRPGQYSAPLQAPAEQTTAMDGEPEAPSAKSPLIHSRPQSISTVANTAMTFRSPSEEPAVTSMGERVVDIPSSDPGPFWETQPLLDMEMDASRPAWQSPPESPSSLPRMPSQLIQASLSSLDSPTLPEEPPRTATDPSNITDDDITISGSEEESPLSSHSREGTNNSTTNPDKTVITSTPNRWAKRMHLGQGTPSSRRGPAVVGTSLVPDSSPTVTFDETEDWGGDGERTMVEGNWSMLRYADVTRKENEDEVDLSSVTRGMKSLSPFKRPQRHLLPAQKETQQTLRMHGGEIIFIDDDNPQADAVGHLKAVASHHTLPHYEEEVEESQPYTQLWPGTSLPPEWKTSFETPKKQKRRGSNSVRTGVPFPGDINDHDDWDDEHASDDAFGPEVTPQTAEREWPDVVRAFEALPRPFPGMFSGFADGESEGEGELKF